MSKKIKKSALKSASLTATGRQRYNLDEYVYIKSFQYDDNNNIKVNYYLLLDTDVDYFDLIANVSTPDFKYNIADGKPFTDIDGNLVYKIDQSGNTVYEDVEVPSVDASGNTITDSSGNTVTEIVSKPAKRLDDFTRNYIAFSTMLIPYIFADVKHHLGYHANENGALDNPE